MLRHTVRLAPWYSQWAAQTAAGECPVAVAICSPSPRPSPSGRGSRLPHARCSRSHLDSAIDRHLFPLSLRERGKETRKCSLLACSDCRAGKQRADLEFLTSLTFFATHNAHFYVAA